MSSTAEGAAGLMRDRHVRVADEIAAGG